MIEDVLSEMNEGLDKAISALRNELAKLRTGRASISILDPVRVDYWGTPTPLNQCASLQTPDARMITVKPFEKNMISAIERAISLADIGIMPQNDGEMIRLPIPPLNEERRKQLAKQAKGKGEDTKIAMRNQRRDANDMLKEFEKDKEISEDDLKRGLEKVQNTLDTFTKQVDKLLETKEAEIMEV